MTGQGPLEEGFMKWNSAEGLLNKVSPPRNALKELAARHGIMHQMHLFIATS